MKSLEVRIAHDLEQAEVRRRLDAALVKARDQYAEQVGPIDAVWEDHNRMRLRLAVMGMNFDGNVEILVEELLVRLELPAMAALFAGRIRSGIEERLGGLLGSQQV